MNGAVSSDPIKNFRRLSPHITNTIGERHIITINFLSQSLAHVDHPQLYMFADRKKKKQRSDYIIIRQDTLHTCVACTQFLLPRWDKRADPIEALYANLQFKCGSLEFY